MGWSLGVVVTNCLPFCSKEHLHAWCVSQQYNNIHKKEAWGWKEAELEPVISCGEGGSLSKY